MNPFTKVVGALQGAADHPLNRGRKFKAVLEYGFIQVATRLIPGEVCVPFPNNTRLLISPRMKGAAHYITPGLPEFEAMAFAMHFLRANDRFVDVGANVGAFTVLAAGVAGATVTAFEASPDTFQMLKRNIGLNGLNDRVNAINAAVGRTEGTAQFSVGLGTENFVASNGGAGESVTVKMIPLDKELAGNPPALIKVDVEGFETEVFGGAMQTLKQPGLRAIIAEKCNVGNRYGFDEAKLHREIRACGFIPCVYEPFDRKLSQASEETEGNLIYVRDLATASECLRAAPAFKIGNLNV